MRHPACATLPHAAFRVLCILVVGKAKHRNGTLACAESYAAEFGITSSDTLARALEELQARGLIEVTRRVQRLQRWPTLWAVTWWPIANRDGQPLAHPEPASHAYTKWIESDERRQQRESRRQAYSDRRSNGQAGSRVSSLRPSGHDTPTIGVETGAHHSDSTPKSTFHHSDGRGTLISRSGAALRARLRTIRSLRACAS